MTQLLGNLTPFTSLVPFTTFLPTNILSSTTTATFSTTTTTTNRWTLFVIGGTAIAVVAFGGSAAVWPECSHFCPNYSREGVHLQKPKSELKSSKHLNSAQKVKTSDMFSIASYLVEKISSFIPWGSAASVLEKVSGNRRHGVEGVELGERVESENEGEGSEEVERLRRLLEETKIKAEEGARALEEIGELRNEVQRLKKELGGGQDEKGKQKAREEKGDREVEEEVADSYSITQACSLSQDEVISLLESLNTEIMEVARTVARAFANTRRPAPPLPSEGMSEDLKEAIGSATEILGPTMVELLQTSQSQGMNGEDNVVKMALRSSMTAYTHWIISSWYFENPEDEHLLSEIYARVRETEEQTVSGHWRALTRVHLQRMLAAEPDLTIYMVDAFVNILLTAGWHNDAAALQEYLIETFGHSIGHVLEKAKRLNKVIGEEIVKCDLEALYIAPDVIFNESTMMEVGGQGQLSVDGTDSEERVLCTTALGLVKAEKKVGKVGEWEEGVLLKPSVILQSCVVDTVRT